MHKLLVYCKKDEGWWYVWELQHKVIVEKIEQMCNAASEIWRSDNEMMLVAVIHMRKRTHKNSWICFSLIWQDRFSVVSKVLISILTIKFMKLPFFLILPQDIRENYKKFKGFDFAF